jgi:photosystem II stability/assembly factor-like uncharacterized protein
MRLNAGFFMLFFMCTPCFAQTPLGKTTNSPLVPLTFEEIDGPRGERILSVACAPDGTVLAGTQEHGVLRSTDNGDSWQRTAVNSGPIWPLYALSDGLIVAFQPLEDVAYPKRSISISTDYGITWPAPSDSLDRYLGHAVLRMFDDVLYSSRSGALHRSSDAGRTWVTLPARPFDPCWGDVDLQILSDSIMFAEWAGELRRTTDAGMSWQDVQMYHRHPTSMARDPLGGILVTAYDTANHERPMEVVRLNREGKQVDVLGTVSDTLTTNRTIVLSSGIMLTASNWPETGVMRSTDSCRSWHRTTLYPEHVHDFAQSADGTVFAATYGSVYRSTDDGLHWESCTNGLARSPIRSLFHDSTGVLYAGSFFSGLYRSFDDGESWVSVGADGYVAHTGYVCQSGHLFLGVNAEYPRWYYSNYSHDYLSDGYGRPGILASVDSGESWSIPDQKPRDFPTVFAQGRGLRVYGNGRDWNISDDGGLTWRFDSTLRQVRSLAWSEDGLFAVRSGAIWQKPETGEWRLFPSDQKTNALAHDGYSLLAVSDEHIARFDDLSSRWITSPLSESIWWSPTLKVLDHGISVILTGQYWFELGVDFAQNWRRVAPLHDRNMVIHDAVISRHGQLLLATNRGLMRGSYPPSGAISIPHKFRLGIPYPNPADRFVHVPYSLEESGNVRITVTSLDGREHHRLFEGYRVAGEYFARLDNYSHWYLLPGLYFINLSVNGRVQTQPIILK